MSLNPFVRSSVVIGALWLAGSAAAGTFFRLEVGPPVAAGTQAKKDKSVVAVRPLACNDLASVQITGTAEGLLDGQHRSVALTLLPIGHDGIHLVQQQWSGDGQWVLHLAGTCGSPKSSASTIVPLGKSGFIRDKVQVLSQPATRAQIDAALADLARSQS
jgi:hypothetical protein